MSGWSLYEDDRLERWLAEKAAAGQTESSEAAGRRASERDASGEPAARADEASTLRWIAAMHAEGVSALIANVDTKLRVLHNESLGVTLPLSVGDREYGDSYVFSPYTHYVSYAREELSMLQSRAARVLLGAVLTPAGWLLKASRFNRAVQVGNRLLSTNLYPALGAAEIRGAAELLLREFPDRSIIFRSLNPRTTPLYLETLTQMGFRLIPSRQVYLYDSPKRVPSKARWLQKRDYGLLEKEGYAVCGPEELSANDAPRLAELYRLLYIDKYSAHNPVFTPRFFELAVGRRLLNIHALRSRATGRLDAVLGYYIQDGIMTTPVFGYDTSMPQTAGLYRMLSAVLLRLAAEEGVLLHESAGAARFKRNRGATAEIEYSAVYDRHLPPHRRMGWALLSPLLNRVGVPIMRKHKF
ncbi:GNAT family N-acetyltransferase [Saccharibacillus alkalitolerans]|uniref:GNAT family N-acetyltransferase n=1 Tax=Saccharibacillus alkalitolerans TaxID=2705290 RepID=A0ABX0F8J9_9BACL|nr:GNAT family N-acetyltransferase [Saccharibacillus alkalitolerans]NGZ76299.1 GNAT family N-acetyltransferase [Saccharibacillus alkalitolerans]